MGVGTMLVGSIDVNEAALLQVFLGGHNAEVGMQFPILRSAGPRAVSR
jgi:hypothetical protein